MLHVQRGSLRVAITYIVYGACSCECTFSQLQRNPRIMNYTPPSDKNERVSGRVY